jgi:membrane protein
MVYSTLIAVVPCIAVIYVVLNRFGVIEPVAAALGEYVVSTFGEKTGNTLIAYLNTFTENAMSLGIVSMVSFAITFVLLVDKIFSVFNKIYHIHRVDNPIVRYLKHAGVIALGLAAIVLAVFLMGRFNFLVLRFRQMRLSVVEILVKHAIQVASIFGILLAMIVLIPHGKVNFRSGVIGAAFGTVGLYALGYLFGFVVKYSVKYSLIYGSLATLMFSFMFLSYLWKIVFAAVTISYVHQKETVGFEESDK